MPLAPSALSPEGALRRASEWLYNAAYEVRRFFHLPLTVLSAVVVDDRGRLERDFTGSLRFLAWAFAVDPVQLRKLARMFAPPLAGVCLVRYRWKGRVLRLAFETEGFRPGPGMPVKAVVRGAGDLDVTQLVRSIRGGSDHLEPPVLRAVLMHEVSAAVPPPDGTHPVPVTLEELTVQVDSRIPPGVRIRRVDTPL